MCLIVDSNSVCAVFLKTKPKFEELRRAVEAKRAKIIYGGKLTHEYRQVYSFWRLLIALDRQGSARQVDNDQVDRETARLMATGGCKSNDPHVIALARVGGARLICSEDRKLQKDVRNPNLLSKPRGNIYTKSGHRALIRRHCG